ncbi:peptide ABC transporter substrate-binding protein [Polycladomyces abyssicola]|uniref:Peptide ABC transporter substrate-binding protein n=1 Tax=Polycladomyces abyssicola TaxID=1125966 RepID=A0A8D5ZMR6_9BACL|nr:peptide ABC transporter substrate-binding protein [Polycladomyces abyssicola]BCU81167.1 peptide ABC transporter substrate-binding protein [Polycladomyces abyssicola]
MKRWVATTTAILMVLSMVLLAACGKGDSNAMAEKQVLNVGYIVSEPPALDPLKATDDQSGLILRHIMEGLVRVDKNGKVEPGMATNWDVMDGGKKIVFHLRDAKWSNGDPVTAHDFEFAWKRLLDPKNAAEYAYQLFYLKNGEAYNSGKAKAEDVGVKALDDKTLEVTLEAPVPYFVTLTSFYPFFPVNKKVVEKDPNWGTNAKTYVSNGPFLLKTWVHDKKVEIVKNPNYWNAKRIKLSQINFPFVGEEQTEYQMYVSGSLDINRNVPNDLAPKLIKEKKAKVNKDPSMYFYVFNTKKKPFDNVKIRKAFSLAIDREAIVKDVLGQGQTPATGWVPWGIPDFAQNKEWVQTHDPYIQPKANPAEAKKLLQEGMKEAGISKLPEITISYNTNDGHKKIAEAVQQMWKQNLGVNVKLANMEWKVFLDNLTQGNFQVARYGWYPDYIDPMTFIDLWVTGGGNNHAKYSNPQYDALIKQAKSTDDQKVRMEAMHKAEEMLARDIPVTPIYNYTRVYQIKDYVKGFYQEMDGQFNFLDTYLTEK